jgi:hypothetical protein
MLLVLRKRRCNSHTRHTRHCDNLTYHPRFQFLSGSLKCIGTRQILGARSSGCVGNLSYVLQVPISGCLTVSLFRVAAPTTHLLYHPLADLK